MGGMLGRQMYRKIWPAILALAFVCVPVKGYADGAVPAAESERYPKVKEALDDGFYKLAELLVRDALEAKPRQKAEQEAILLLAQSLWGQQRHEEILTLLDGRQEPTPGEIYWRARSLFELKRYDAALRLLSDELEPFKESRFAPAAMRLRGHVEEFLGLLDAATATFLRFNATFPNDPDLLENDFDLADVYVRQKKMQEAIAVYKGIIGGPDKLAVEQAQLELGKLLYRQGASENFAEARNLLVKLATDESARLMNRISAWVELAALEEKAGEKVAAETSMTQAILLSPDAKQRVPLKLTMAQMLLRHGNGEQALKLLEECRTEAPNETVAAELQLEKASALFYAGQFAEADAAYQIYLDVSTDVQGRARAWFGKGLCLWELTRYAEASAAFDKAAQDSKKPIERASALFKAGDAYYQTGKFSEAVQRYSQFVQGFPASDQLPNALYQLGLAQDSFGSKAEALQTFQKLEGQYSGTSFAEQAALQIAGILRRDNKWAAALDKYTRIGETYTNSTVIALSRHQSGLVLRELGRYEEAQQAFESVVKDYPKSEFAPQATYMRGFCLYRLNKVEEAVKVCEDFIKNYSGSPWMPEVVFWLAEKQFNQGSYAEAEKRFLQIVDAHKEHPLAPRALYWAGSCARAQNEYVKAVERFSQLAKDFPQSSILPQTRFAQGDALTELGEHASAIFAFEEIIKKFPNSDLLNAAWGRKGDCLFVLAVNDPRRYGEAIKCFQAILDRPSAPLALRMQAGYKIGRCFEKTAQPEKAFSRYMNVVYTYRNESGEYSPDSVMWFTRAAFGAAAIREKERAWYDAVKVYGHVIEADVPAREEAQKRIENIKKENWLLFQRS